MNTSSEDTLLGKPIILFGWFHKEKCPLGRAGFPNYNDVIIVKNIRQYFAVPKKCYDTIDQEYKI
jgi:hypothetical protein